MEVRWVFERVLGEGCGFVGLRYACLEDLKCFLEGRGFRLVECESLDDVVARDYMRYIGSGVEVEIYRRVIGATLQPTYVSWRRLR